MQGVNKKIPVEPFARTSIEVVANNGFATASQKTGLTALKVVFPAPLPEAPGGRLEPGDIVWVRGESAAHQFAKEAFTVDDKTFILLPSDLVVLLDPQLRAPNIPGFSWTLTAADTFKEKTDP